MGILSTLLTGGALVGKVCQSLATALSATDKDTGITVSLSSLNIGGVKFIKSNADGNTMKTYAFNSNFTGTQSIAFPNINENGGGASLLISAGSKDPIDNFITENVSPDTNIVIGPATDSVTGVANDDEGVLRLVMNNLTIGNGSFVNIGGFSITLDTTQLIIGVVVGGVVVLGLRALNIIGHNGVRANDNEDRAILLEPLVKNNEGEQKYVINVPFQEYGFKKGDGIYELTLSLEVKEAKQLFSKNSSSLHPVELKLIEQLTCQINASYESK